MASYSAIITSAEVSLRFVEPCEEPFYNTSAEVIIVGGQIFKITASCFVNVSEEEINLMKENAIPRNTKHATKFGMTHFKGKM